MLWFFKGCCVVYLQIFLQIKLAKLKLKEAGSWGIIGDGERVLKTGGAEPLVIHFVS